MHLDLKNDSIQFSTSYFYILIILIFFKNAIKKNVNCQKKILRNVGYTFLLQQKMGFFVL